MDKIINYNRTISPPNNKTRIVSFTAVVFFLIAMVFGAYMVSLDKKKLASDDFTISRALEFGNKYIMITFFTLSFVLIIYLNYLRSNKFLYFIRIILLLIVYSLLITILWVTVTYDKNIHYILAGIIFTCNIIFLFLIEKIFEEYLKNKKYYQHFLDISITLSIITWIALIVFGILDADKNDLIADEEIFAICENITVLLTAIPIMFLGFI